MEEPVKSPPSAWPTDLKWLAVLVILALVARVWQITHTEVLARDSIGFIRLAWQLEHEPWSDVLHKAEHHPGYPLLVLAVSLPLRALIQLPTPIALQLSAQIVTATASVLLILPMFLLGRALFSQRVALWACLLFQFLPASTRLFGDGLTEASYLLFAMTAIYFAHIALQTRSPVWFALCGVCGGLAYWTRPEGALIVAATGAVLLALQILPQQRRPWKPVLAGMGSLVVGAALIGVPLFLLSGRILLKPAAAMMLVTSEYNAPLVPEPPPEPDEPRSQRGTMSGPLWGVWWQDETELGSKGWLWGTRAVAHELMKGFQYFLWLPALMGLIVYRRTLAHPAAWVMLLVCASIVGLLWRLASIMGYVSDRHMILIVMCGCFWAVAVLEVWVTRFARKFGPACTGVVIVGMVLLMLPATLEPLHGDRAGFREVGLWLGEHADPADPILDPYCWTAYYAGVDFRPKLEGKPSRYVVLEQSHNAHGHLPLHRRAQTLSQRGELVYRWTRTRGKRPVEIQVYALPRR